MRFTLISSIVGKLSAVKTSILAWGRGPAPLWVQDWPYYLGYARVSSSKRRQIVGALAISVNLVIWPADTNVGSTGHEPT